MSWQALKSLWSLPVFSRSDFYLQEANRYLRIAELTDQVYVLAAKGTSFSDRSEHFETIAFASDDALVHEWHLVVISEDYNACFDLPGTNVSAAGGRASA